MSSGHGERQYIGAEIRRLRLERGMTLDDLAEAAMISASHLSRVERGLTLPIREQLKARGVSASANEEIVRMRVPARRSLAAALGE